MRPIFRRLVIPGFAVLTLLAVGIVRHQWTMSPAITRNAPIPGETKHIQNANSSASGPTPLPPRGTETESAIWRAITAINSEDDPDRRTGLIENAAASVRDNEVSPGLRLLAADTRPASAELCTALVRRWAEADPSAAAAAVSQLLLTAVYSSALEQVGIAWANRDLPAARDWAISLPDGPAGQAASLAVAYEAARSDPVTAVELAGRLPPSARRDDLLIHALSQWPVSDASAAQAWAMQVGQPDLRQHLVSAASVATAEQDGAAGALLAATALSSGNEQDCAVVSVVQRWAQQSPAETAAWISQFPEVPARAPAVQNLLAMWLPQDSQAARDWVETLPNSAFRAEAIAAYRMWERE